MEEKEILIPEEEEQPKFHYEATYEAREELPVYDADGNRTGTEMRVKGRILKKVWTDEDELKKQYTIELKAELADIKEDIEQEAFGLVRDDYAEKKARAAEIINELRALEGKTPRAVAPGEAPEPAPAPETSDEDEGGEA